MSIAVIWAWASGMLCAANLLENWVSDVYLFEKNIEIWKKVSITGWWRCNITTGFFNLKTVLSNYVRWSDFLLNSIKVFGPKKTIKWFIDRWVGVKTEKDNRVFPISNHSSDVINLFKNIFLKYSNFNLMLWESVMDISKSEDKFLVKTDKWKYIFDYIVITTWWNAYQNTWSSWDAYSWALKLWHKITKLWPSLNSFEVLEWFIKDLSGLSFVNSSLEFTVDNNRHSLTWPMIFTHWWISGPVVFAMSSHLAFQKIDNLNSFKCYIFFDKQKNVVFRDKTFLEFINKYPKKTIRNMLLNFFSKRFIDLYVKIYFLELDIFCSLLSKENRKKLSTICQWVSVILVSRKKWDEFVTAWWVDTDLVDSLTMESKICDNLFFAWEVLNIDWFTWGFNLQAARSTWMLASKSILLKLKKQLHEE